MPPDCRFRPDRDRHASHRGPPSSRVAPRPLVSCYLAERVLKGRDEIGPGSSQGPWCRPGNARTTYSDERLPSLLGDAPSKVSHRDHPHHRAPVDHRQVPKPGEEHLV